MEKSITEYYIIEHNPNLFVVMSYVTTKGLFGQRTCKNFVAETKTREEAETIINLLEV